MGTSLRSDIQQALVERLRTITEANGYPVTVAFVESDKIPTTDELQSHQLPAILAIDEAADVQHARQELDLAWSFRLQIVHTDVADEAMNLLIRSVAKALFANSPTAQRTDAFRIHPAVYQVVLGSLESDLHMVEGNRVAVMQIVVQFRTTANEL